VLHELADPLGVLDVGLPPGDVAQVVRVEQPALEPILQRLEHGLPVHAGGLHPDERHPCLGQPRRELSEPRERRAERPGLLVEAATTRARDANGRHDVVAMHIQTRAPLHHHIRLLLPSDDG
jgi:alkylhydroperoxidase family enzyme